MAAQPASSLAHHAEVTADQLAQAMGESGLFGPGVKAAARAQALGVGVAETLSPSLAGQKVSFLWLGDSGARWTPLEQLIG